MLRLAIPLAALASCATPECSDGIDNDGNGTIDFPDDPSCKSADDDTEQPDILGQPWTETTMLEPDGQPARRLETGAGALGTRLVLVGGFSAGMTEGLPITTEVLTYDTLADVWGTLPAAPVAWTHANVAAVGGTVYLLGGLDGFSFVAERQVYVLEAPIGGEPATAWVPIEEATVPGESIPAGQERGAAAVVLSPGHIFLIGGASTGGTLDSILDFDLSTRTWSIPTDDGTIPKLPTPRSHAAAMRQFDGTFIVAGGLEDNTTTRPLADVYAYQPDPGGGETVWQLRDSMPTARGGCAYGVAFGHLICAGGEAGLDALDVVEIYDPVPTTDAPGGRWTVATPMPEPRAGARGTVIADRLYVPGGSATLAFEPTETLFVFSPLVP